MVGHPLLWYMIAEIARTLPQPRGLETLAPASLDHRPLSVLESFLAAEDLAALDAVSRAARGPTYTIKTTGPGLLTRSVHHFLRQEQDKDKEREREMKVEWGTRLGKSRVMILPTEVFSPIPNTVRVGLEEQHAKERDALKKVFVIEGMTVAVHWWQRSWQR